MEELFTLFIEYWTMWAPALTSCLAIFVALIPGIVKIKGALTEIKNSKEFAEVKTKLETVAAENQELIRCNKLLIDKIAKIEGYSDAVLPTKEG